MGPGELTGVVTLASGPLVVHPWGTQGTEGALRANPRLYSVQQVVAMLIELHCHTNRYSSCSVLDPVRAVVRAREMGLWGLVITEHQVLWSPQELDALRLEAEVGDAFVLLAAQEVETDLGHVLVVGADRSLPGHWKLGKLRRDWPKAALVWAHPYRHGRRPLAEQLTLSALDALVSRARALAATLPQKAVASR